MRQWTLEDFKSHLIDVEYVVNSRPLCRSNNEEIITPQHLLDGVGEIRVTPLSTPTADITLEENFKHIKQLPKHYQDIRDKKNTFWNALQTLLVRS